MEQVMKILVDTHLLIWSTSDSGKLPGAARAVLENAANECFFSAASIWEIALKHTKHPNDIPLGAEDARQMFLKAGYLELAVSARHSSFVDQLPRIHLDTFDRMLVAQAQLEGMQLVTHDHVIPQYGSFVVRV